jgi:O-antigen ligase
MYAAVSRRLDFAANPAVLLGAATVTAGLLGGILIASRGAPGLAFILGLIYIPIAVVRLPVALALWVPLVVLSRMPGVGLGSTMAMVVLVMGWLGLLANAGPARALYLKGRALPIGLALALFIWVTLSLLWAVDAGLAGAALFNWLSAVITLVLVATAIVRIEDARLLAAAFVGAMLVSVAIGLVNPAATAQTAIDLASESEDGRFAGASGDPNYLAAGIVPALALIAGLLRRGQPLRNVALGGSALILVFSLAATQSRGGLLAAAIAMVAALVLFRGRRPYIVIGVLTMVAAAAIWFSMNPEGLERITQSDKGGTGRTELWSIGLRMAQDHPVAGVGIENFVRHSRAYVRRPGSLEFVAFTEQPYVPHNVYIGLLAELGLVGLGLYLALLAACIAAAIRAARGFERLGDRYAAALAQASAVAIIGSAVASVFISNPTDGRTWILLGLGPALLAMARRREAGAATALAIRGDSPHHGVGPFSAPPANPR